MFSVEESEQPERYLLVLAHLGVVSCLDDIGCNPRFVGLVGVADAELQFIVNDIAVGSCPLVDAVVFPQTVDKEGLHRLLRLHFVGVDGIEQVGVVQHDFGRFLGNACPTG